MPPKKSFQIEQMTQFQLMTFQRLFDQLMEYAIEFETLRKNLMSMAYRFLFDNAKQITREQSLNSKVPA